MPLSDDDLRDAMLVSARLEDAAETYGMFCDSDDGIDVTPGYAAAMDDYAEFFGLDDDED